MIYQNPYGGDEDPLDPDAARRKALLDLMGTSAQPGTPTASQALPSSRPAPMLPTGTSRSTAANGADTPDLPDPTSNTGVNPTPSAAGNPYQNTDDGRHYGSQILDLYDDPYTRRNTYGGSDPKRQAIASALVSSGNPYAMAAGAVGYLDAYLHRHADTAPTDFSVTDATQIIKNAYHDMFGREATDQEIHDALVGQGLKPGDEWVGQAGLQGVLGHLAENAATERAAGGGPTSAASASPAASSAATTAATPGAGSFGPYSNDQTATTGTSVTTPSGSTLGGGAGGSASGGGVPGNIEGVDAGKWGDPNKHDPKYDVLHAIANAGSLDAAWPQIQQLYPGATRVSQDVVDFGGDIGRVDLQRDVEGGGGFHWEPVGGASDSAASAAPASASGSSPLTPPGAAQLAAPLTNNDVYAQIQDELQRIIRGDAPRNAILSQMGLV